MVGNFLSGRQANRGVSEELADRLRQSGWKVFRTSDRRRRLPRLLAMQWKIWRCRHQFDVAQVDVFSGLAFLWAEAAALSLRRLGKPFVLTLHGGLLPDFARRWPRRVRRLLGRARAVTTPSAYLQEALEPCRQDLTLIPNPLEVGDYPFRCRSHPAPRLLWLRAFHETYNPSLAPQVLALLRQEFPEAQLTMVGPDKGDGALRRTLETAARLGVSDALKILPGIAKREVPAVLAEGEIFLNTTHADNTPVSVLEALATGLCVVSTDVGGLRHLLQDDEDALLVPPDDARAMARAVSRILKEPGLAERLSRGGRQKVEAFDWAQILPRWQGLLAEIARRRG
jgi:glycosyltransferase involved in cell wall biosynthesis